MEVLKLYPIGYYHYESEIKLNLYDPNNPAYCKECVICKSSLFEPSHEVISSNSNLKSECNISIGKCGHIFHEDCLNKWLKKNNTCPIDGAIWCLHRIADTTTNLVVKNNKCLSKINKNCLSNKFIKKKY